MPFKFIFTMLSNKWFTNLLSILSVAFITFFTLSFCSSVDQNYELFMLTGQFQLSNKIIYTTNRDFYYSNDDKKAESEKIALVDGVSSVENIKYFDVYSAGDGVQFKLMLYDTNTLRQMRYSLPEGRYPSGQEDNSVLLPYAYKSIYDIGDQIEIIVCTLDETSDQMIMTPANIVVSGYLGDKHILTIDAVGTSLGLQHIFINSNYGVIYSLVDQQGEPIVPINSDYFIISLDNPSDIDKVNSLLKDVVDSPAFLHPGPKMIENYVENNEIEIVKMIGFGLSSLALTISLLLASTLMSLVEKKREMSIYFMCGATWKQSLCMILVQQCICILAGFLLGLGMILYANQSHIFYITIPEIKPMYIIITSIFEITIFALAILPFYWMTFKKSPIEIFRKD